LTIKVEKPHQLLKPQNLKQLKNWVLLFQNSGEKNDKNLEIFTVLSKPQNCSKLEILVYYCKFRKMWLKIGKIAKLSKAQTFKGLENYFFLL
jgi:hypothetical protein